MVFATVSYRGDLQRLKLMIRSMDMFYQGKSKAIVIVPRQDISLFRSEVNYSRRFC